MGKIVLAVDLHVLFLCCLPPGNNAFTHALGLHASSAFAVCNAARISRTPGNMYRPITLRLRVSCFTMMLADCIGERNEHNMCMLDFTSVFTWKLSISFKQNNVEHVTNISKCMSTSF